MSAIDRESPGVNDRRSALCPAFVERATVPAQSIQSSTWAPTNTTLSFPFTAAPGSVSAGTPSLCPLCCARASKGSARPVRPAQRNRFLRDHVICGVLLSLVKTERPAAIRTDPRDTSRRGDLSGADPCTKEPITSVTPHPGLAEGREGPQFQLRELQ